jgi:hypothetical protein
MNEVRRLEGTVMTLDELATTLPNRFHDAEVSSLAIDYLRRELRLRMRVWVEREGTPEDQTYRTAVVTLSGLQFCVIEPPDPSSPYRKPGAITIDTGTVESLASPPAVALPEVTAEGAFKDWLFVRGWNSFIYLSALAASLVWAAEPGPPGPE